jgi:hypothetical protein
LLSSCRHQPLKIAVAPLERVPVDLPKVAPLTMEPIQWYVVTPENFEEMQKKFKENGVPPAFFSLDERGYGNIAVNMAKIRSYILQQKAVIDELQKYYQPSPPVVQVAPKVTPPVEKPVRKKFLGIF